MHRRRRATLIATACLLLAAAAHADYRTDLRAALAAHEAASSLEEQAQALEAFRQVTRDHPSEWLGHFWTSYEETQIAMLTRRSGEADGDTLSAFLDRAQSHLERAKELNSAATDRDASSLEVLQALIFRFRAWGSEDGAEWSERSSAALHRAATVDALNPVVMVMLGTDLAGRGRGEENRSLLLAARHLLRQAEEATRNVNDRARTTLFNSEWIQFWLPGVEQALAALEEPS